jgi:hypothetical protein
LALAITIIRRISPGNRADNTWARRAGGGTGVGRRLWTLLGGERRRLQDLETVLPAERGEVISGGARYPLVFVRREGKGKWVLINLAPIFRMGEPFGDWEPLRHTARFRLLRAIVEKYAGVRLPYRFEMQTYQGLDCALAIWEPAPEGDVEGDGARVQVTTRHRRVVAFEAFEHRMYGGRSLAARAGRVQIPADMGPGRAKLWVVKPYGKPVVLMTDGTLPHRARLDDGRVDGRALTFRFAERAYISSPMRPARVLIDGNPAPFAYDEATGLLTIERTGMAAEARVEM